MARFNNPLDNVRVAAPCSADWDQMIGNERARFCGQCNLNVYNLSSMTKSEAESFILSGEGRICVRYYRRSDGSILTKNCPVGLRAIRRRMSSVARAISSALLSLFAGLGIYQLVGSVVPEPQPHVMGVMAEPMETHVSPVEMGELPVMSTPVTGRLIPISRYKKTSRKHR